MQHPFYQGPTGIRRRIGDYQKTGWESASRWNSWIRHSTEALSFLAEREGIAIQLDLRPARRCRASGTRIRPCTLSCVTLKLRFAPPVGRILRQHSLTTIVRDDTLLVTSLEAADSVLTDADFIPYPTC